MKPVLLVILSSVPSTPDTPSKPRGAFDDPHTLLEMKDNLYDEHIQNRKSHKANV